MKKQRLFIMVFFITVVFNNLWAQEDIKQFRVMFWNVENLFDTRHDTLKNDYEFLPDALRHWTPQRFKKKIDNVARVIAAVGENAPPTLVGLCEVENEYVLKSLTQYSPLKEQTYRYITTESADERGIDVALLYQRDQFKPIETKKISITPLTKQQRHTRDILYVSGLLPTKDTLNVFIIHAPSKAGGVKETEPLRNHVMKTLRSHIDTLYTQRKSPNIIIMGDFNAQAKDKSLSKFLGVQEINDSITSDNLYFLLTKQLKSRKKGSYKYKGQWELIDHIIVSGSLLHSDANIYTANGYAKICELSFLLSDDLKYGGKQPFRTYHGMRYQGGFSDHLPIYTDLILKYLPVSK